MSPSRNTQRKTSWNVVLALAGLVLVTICISWARSFRGTTAPIYGDVIGLATHTKSSLIKQVVALKTDRDAANASLIALSTLEAENAALKAELGRHPEDKKSILGRVVIPPNRSLYDTLMIDVGSDDGVTVGQAVYAFDAIALGTISDVTSDSATVLLYSASGRQTVGTTTGSDIAVTLIGRGSGEYEVRMPRDIVFQTGGVITEQTLGVHPLATIQKIVTDPRDPFQRLLAKVPVNLQTMKWVVVK